jgi:hypothetical protein
MKFMEQSYNNGTILRLLGVIKDDRFTVTSVIPRGLLRISVKIEDASTVLRSHLFNAETIFDALFSVAREVFESHFGYRVGERSFERVSL